MTPFLPLKQHRCMSLAGEPGQQPIADQPAAAKSMDDAAPTFNRRGFGRVSLEALLGAGFGGALGAVEHRAFAKRRSPDGYLLTPPTGKSTTAEHAGIVAAVMAVITVTLAEGARWVLLHRNPEKGDR